MTDVVSIGAIVASILTALGIRDLLKLYIGRHEGCGRARCREQLAMTTGTLTRSSK